ncbi:hypothetical protein D9M73_243870 [compost metagenome]
MPRSKALKRFPLGIQLCAQPVLRQLGGGQSLAAQHQFLLLRRHSPLQAPGENGQRHRSGKNSEQQIGQIDRHSALRGRWPGRKIRPAGWQAWYQRLDATRCALRNVKKACKAAGK